MIDFIFKTFRTIKTDINKKYTKTEMYNMYSYYILLGYSLKLIIGFIKETDLVKIVDLKFVLKMVFLKGLHHEKSTILYNNHEK